MILRLVFGVVGTLWLTATAAQPCGTAPVQVQVLGSGGPELAGKRASSSYLVWIGGKPRVLVDIGGGAVLRFGESGATVSDLDVILFTHLHVDHSAGLPALIKSSFFEDRQRPLPIYGPGGNKFMPSTVSFVRSMFDSTRGAYRYLGDFLSPMTSNTYKLQPRDVGEVRDKIRVPRKTGDKIWPVFANNRLQATAAAVAHGSIPALAWRIETAGKRIVFSGDTNGDSGYLKQLAAEADLLIAHNAVAEGASGVERNLHMPPSVIGRIAHEAHVKQLVLSHRMLRTLGRESETMDSVRKLYAGPVSFANDLDCFTP